MTDLLLTWLCSYLLHSSLLIGALWAAERAGVLARLARSTQEMLWRLALLGGVLSASLPLVPALVSTPASLPAPGSALEAPVNAPFAARTHEDVAVSTTGAHVAVTAQPVVAMVAPPQDPAPTAQLGSLPLAARLAPQAHDLAVAFVPLWLAGAGLMLAGLALQWMWLRLAVRRLAPVADPRWQRLVRVLAGDMGVPLPVLRHSRAGWASPLLAPGRVLCLPAWCLELPDDEARAVLGHELAHLRRRDPAWRLLAAALKALLWPQALNRIALQRLDLLAELACDAAAAAPAGQRLALAQSLLRCAEALKLQGSRRAPALACGAARGGSSLLDRVRRLLRPEADGAEEGRRERRLVRWGALAAMLATLVALPAVVVSHTDGRGLLERLELDGVAEALHVNDLTLSTRGKRIYSRYPGGSFSVTLDGQVEFSESEDEVQALTGTLVVREREGGLTREMKLTSMGEGRVERVYRIGKDVVTLDEAGRRWWAKAVQRMAETLTDPLVRARKLHARGGIDAAVADVEHARDDFVRRRRIDALLKLGEPLPAAAQQRLIAAAAATQGGFERREALAALARQSLAEPEQLAWLAAASGIDGDFDKREALGALAPGLSVSPAVLAAWGAALSHIGGDFELRSAIEAQVAATPQPAVLVAALQASRRLQGDFDKREALAAIARRLQGDEHDLVAALAAATSGISGNFERREALNVLLDRPRLDTVGLERVLSSAEGMEGGFERLQVLLRVAEKLGQAKPVDAGLVERVRRAGRGLGEHERGQIENALDRLG